MNYTVILCAVVAGATLTMTLNYCAKPIGTKMISEQIKTVDDIKALFPTSPEQIKDEADRLIAQNQKAVDALIAIPSNERTFENTAKALDDICARSDLAVKDSAISIIEYLHPDKAMRDTAHDTVKKISDYFVDQISTNKKLYDAFKAYAQGNALTEDLTQEQRYFIEESMKDFKRAGLDLPDEQLAQVKAIKKKLTELAMEFGRNIAQDNRTMTASTQDLAGLEDDFIGNLKQDKDGNYLLGADYPTYFQVMQHATSEETRKKMHTLFSTRAYPINEKLLAEIVTLRDQLAKLLGYNSFAALNISNQMAATPERVNQFLSSLRDKAAQKENQELDAFVAHMPESATLAADGKVNAWDLAHIKAHYKEKKFNVDERKVAQYFPMQKTIDALLDIYRQFLAVDFKEEPVSGLWHDDVRLVKVTDKEGGQLYGYLFLDLYPRDNK